MARGLPSGRSAGERSNLTRPGVIEEIARLYVEAGADLITTNTFGGSPARLRQFGLDGQTEAVNRAAVEAVRRAARGRAYVSGVGRALAGTCSKPYGDGRSRGHRRGLRAADPRARRGRRRPRLHRDDDRSGRGDACRAGRQVGRPGPAGHGHHDVRADAPRVSSPSWACPSSRPSAGLSEAGADVVGSNCGNGSVTMMVEIAREFRALTGLPIAIQPNAGLPEPRGRKPRLSRDAGVHGRAGARTAGRRRRDHRRLLRHDAGARPRVARHCVRYEVLSATRIFASSTSRFFLNVIVMAPSLPYRGPSMNCCFRSSDSALARMASAALSVK